MNKLTNQLFRPVDIASIVFVRVTLGLILFLNVASYLSNQFIRFFWTDPEFHFKYFGFSWVKVAPEYYMNVFVAVVALSALFIAIGFLYRISTVIFFIGFSYLFLLDQALYLNHYY